MRFNQHSQLAGKHALLSASSSSWVNYDDDKMERVFTAQLAAKRGTDIHAWAAETVRLGIRQAEFPVTTTSLYINDCIGFRMKPEIVLFYSPIAFGTADAVGFRDNKLRIFDLKTGTLKTSERQLEVYAAYFCLEYGFKPFDIDIELRIYQNNEARVYDVDPIDISLIMEKIKRFEKRIQEMMEETA